MIEHLLNWEVAWGWLTAEDPPIVTKTVIIALIAWIGAQLKAAAGEVYKEIHRRVVGMVYFDNTNLMYQAFSEWYEENYPLSFRRVEAIMDAQYDEGIRNLTLKIRQFSDINYIKYKRHYILVRKSKDRIDGAREHHLRYLETYTLQCFGGHEVLREIVDEVYERFKRNQGSDTGLRAIVTDKWANSKVIHVSSYKTLDQVLVAGKEDLVMDINNFLGKKELYLSQGIRFKRSYLLYGPPGTGKTSLVFAIAHSLKRAVYYLNPSAFMDDHGFEEFVSGVDDESVILIEDVDVFWNTRESSGATSVSFQSLLNVLDGLHSPNNVLIFMTTNRPDNFDEAFLRKGRMDYKMKIPHPDRKIAQKFISQFFKEHVILPDSFKGGIPMVDIQDACIKSSSPIEVVKIICNDSI